MAQTNFEFAWLEKQLPRPLWILMYFQCWIFPPNQMFHFHNIFCGEDSQHAISLRSIYLRIQFKFIVPDLQMKCHLEEEYHTIVGDKSNNHFLF